MAKRSGRRSAYGYRLERLRANALRPAYHPGDDGANAEPQSNTVVDLGWGRVLFGQTFTDRQALIDMLRSEGPDRRDIALYVQDPHLLLAMAPQELFLDPSNTYRLDLATYRAGEKRKDEGFFIRRMTSAFDAEAVNRIYARRGMVPVPPEFFWLNRDSRALTYYVAEDANGGEIIGTVTGIDHVRAMQDPERGSSLWCLAVDPQAGLPGIGEALVRRLTEHYQARGCTFLDLSVLHDNGRAIRLYEKLGFRRVPVFALKRKNQINERLFAGPDFDGDLNPYARLIVDEARRRGIGAEVIDDKGGFFRLAYGGRQVRCRESLSELTSAVAMSICDDKSATRRVVEAAGVVVPEQVRAGDADLDAFLAKHGRVVVKPARGEQGRGVSVGLDAIEAVEAAIRAAREVASEVLVEACFEGQDLRLVIIGFKLVAAAVRRPAAITGDGKGTIKTLIERQSRRRAAATGGESTIPLDAETERCVRQAGHALDDVLPAGEHLPVRKTANLHTGGTIHDVTESVHPRLVEAGVRAARAIDIPVVGVDLMVQAPHLPGYVFIEANERPGLANHEPQPTAARFIDLLFPLSSPVGARMAEKAKRRTDGAADD